jgi:DNA-binding NtrC family response regulator
MSVRRTLSADQHHPALLVVDDDEGVREAYELLFAERMEVIGVGAAADAITAAQARRFEAILLDVRMPHMGGPEAIVALRAAQPGVPIIFVSAVDSVETKVDAMRLGAFDYIVKPFSEERLLNVVMRATGRTPGLRT